MKYYVTYSTFYPIYEPAEGGYYYEGKQIQKQYCCSDWRKAKRIFFKLLKQFDPELDACSPSGYYRISYCPHDLYFFVRDDYFIGEGYIVEVTRYKVEDEGYEPYH